MSIVLALCGVVLDNGMEHEVQLGVELLEMLLIRFYAPFFSKFFKWTSIITLNMVRTVYVVENIFLMLESILPTSCGVNH